MGDASVTLDLDAKEFDARLAAIEQKVAAGTKRMAGSFSGIGGLSLGALGGMFSVGAAASAVKSVIDYGAHVQNLSDRFGVSTDAIQHFGNAAEKNGSSLEAMTMGFNKLEIARSKAMQGDASMADAFLNLGITFEDLRKLNPENIMLKIGQSAMNAAEMVKLLGKNSLELRPILAGVADGQIQFDKAIDKMDIAKLKEADVALKEMGERSRRVIGGLAGTFMRQWDEASVHNRKVWARDKEALSKLGTEIANYFTGKTISNKPMFSALASLTQPLPGEKKPGSTGTSTQPDGKAQGAPKPHRDFSEEESLTYQQFQEATKLSLSQLASLDPGDLSQSVVRRKYIGGDILKARAALNEKDLAGNAAFAGNEKEFNLHNTRFQQLTSGIGSLKESEKQMGLIERVESIEKSAQKIAENTAKQFVNK